MSSTSALSGLFTTWERAVDTVGCGADAIDTGRAIAAAMTAAAASPSSRRVRRERRAAFPALDPCHEVGGQRRDRSRVTGRRVVGGLEQFEGSIGVQLGEQTGQAGQLGDRRAAALAPLKVGFELSALGGGEGSQHVGSVPVGVVGVTGRHRVTPFSCSASRSARNP